MTPTELPRRALLLDDARPGGAALLFSAPEDWIEARTPADVPAALGRIDRAASEGSWIAGGFAFELGYLLEPRLRPLYRQPGDPLIAVGVYRAPETVDGRAMAAALSRGPRTALGAPQAGLDFGDYAGAFARVRDYIAAGDVYQINLTFPLALPVMGDPWPRLAGWRSLARAGHAAILRLDDRDVFSFSPELFLSSDGDGVVRTRPMKGTARRSADAAADEAARAALVADPKQRAENLMIVDLLRNDLSRVCEAGSVKVSDLFTVETYPTLHTMTSGVEGRIHRGLAPSDILKALFPCGSVTGAPKVRAMEIIAETERGPRGFYCGAIGAFGPDLRMNLNVAIRTLVHERGATALRIGVGSGLVYDSEARAEYDECLLKARFASAEPFALLETMRWSPDGGFDWLDLHLERLGEAARYFGVAYGEAALRAALDAHVADAKDERRVRLLVDLDGGIAVESAALTAFPSRLRLHVAEARIASDDPFARRKTTRRTLYDAALGAAKASGADEAILLNEHGRVADGSFTSIFALKDGVLLTPPPSEGALDGVLKQALAAKGAPPVTETPLSLEDLKTADALFAGNSVRGLVPAALL